MNLDLYFLLLPCFFEGLQAAGSFLDLKLKSIEFLCTSATVTEKTKYVEAKEIVERRHGETIKFLFLPKMGLLGSQASTEKKIGCEF